MKEPSFMIVIPMNQKDVEDPMTFIENVKASELVRIENIRMDEQRGMIVDFAVDDRKYEVDVNPEEVEVPGFFRPEHVFSEEEFRQLDEAKLGLSVCMDFNDDYALYHSVSGIEDWGSFRAERGRGSQQILVHSYDCDEPLLLASDKARDAFLKK